VLSSELKIRPNVVLFAVSVGKPNVGVSVTFVESIRSSTREVVR
jgi:hypothetical protein